jgi:hypothetical protein
LNNPGILSQAVSTMSTTNTNSSIPSEDIDLLVLLERTVLFFRRYKWIFLLALVLGLASGYLTWQRLPRIYKSRMVLHASILSNQDYIEIINNWNGLLTTGNQDQLASSLGIPSEELDQVKEIKASEIQKIFTPTNPNGFCVDVIITDNGVLDDLQKGILNGLDNVDYLKKQLASRRENLTILIGEVKTEVAKLDSTKARVEQMLRGNTNRSNSLMIDISGLNNQLIELNEKLLNYKQDLKFTNSAQVLQNFNKFNRPAGPNLIVWLGLGTLSFLAIAYIYALFHSVNRKLKARAQQKQPVVR